MGRLIIQLSALAVLGSCQNGTDHPTASKGVDEATSLILAKPTVEDKLTSDRLLQTARPAHAGPVLSLSDATYYAEVGQKSWTFTIRAGTREWFLQHQSGRGHLGKLQDFRHSDDVISGSNAYGLQLQMIKLHTPCTTLDRRDGSWSAIELRVAGSVMRGCGVDLPTQPLAGTSWAGSSWNIVQINGVAHERDYTLRFDNSSAFPEPGCPDLMIRLKNATESRIVPALQAPVDLSIMCRAIHQPPGVLSLFSGSIRVTTVTSVDKVLEGNDTKIVLSRRK